MNLRDFGNREKKKLDFEWGLLVYIMVVDQTTKMMSRRLNSSKASRNSSSYFRRQQLQNYTSHETA